MLIRKCCKVSVQLHTSTINYNHPMEAPASHGMKARLCAGREGLKDQNTSLGENIQGGSLRNISGRRDTLPPEEAEERLGHNDIVQEKSE